MLFLIGLAATVVVSFASLAVAVILIYRLKIHRIYLYHLAAAINRFPGRLRLKPHEPVAWQKPERASHRVLEFQAAGFAPLGGFLVDELPNARLFALRHPENGLVGIVNETPDLGTWSDVLLFPADGTPPVLASSMLKPALLRFFPGDPKISKPDASVADLVRAVHASARPNLSARPVAPGGFAPLFEQAFADAADARLLEPLDDLELRRLLKCRDLVRACCGEISQKEYEGIRKLLPFAIENELRLTCGAQFPRETTLPASEWQQAINRLLVIHDRTPLNRLAGKLIYGAFLTADMKRRLRRAKSSGNPRADFAAFNERLPAWVRYTRLGQVTRPVTADIYRAPMDRNTP
jgi:hypothetical protein